MYCYARPRKERNVWRRARPCAGPRKTAAKGAGAALWRFGPGTIGAVSAAAILAAMGLSAGQAAAACTTDGTTTTCTGDLSAGVLLSDSGTQTLVVKELTTNIGANGFRFISTGTSDLEVEFEQPDPPSAPWMLDADATGSTRTSRVGLHITGGSDLTANIDAAMTIQAGLDETVTIATLVHDHRDGVRFEAPGDLDIVQTGDVVIDHADLTADSSSVTGVDIGEFRGFFVYGSAPEATPSNITLTRTGALTVNGGSLTAISQDSDGSNRAIAGATSGVSNRLLYGLTARAGGTLDMTNIGTITIDTGARTALTRSVGGRAESVAATPFSAGIALSRSPTGGTSVLSPNEQRLDSALLRQTGDVIVTLGDSTLEAIGETETGGPIASAAIAQRDFFRQSYGVRLDDGLTLDAVIDGAITIDGGTVHGRADALAGTDTARGLVTADLHGMAVYGLHARSVSVSPLESSINNSAATIVVTGDVTATGMSVDAEVAGSGLAVGLVSGFPPDPGGTPAEISMSGGQAIGVSVYDFGELGPLSSSQMLDTVAHQNLTLNGVVSATGGDVTANLAGADLSGRFVGGIAYGLTTIQGSVLNGDALFEATGGSVAVVMTGSHNSIRAQGGYAQGATIDLQSNSDVAFHNDASATGGNASLSGNAASGSWALGGDAIGLQLSLADSYFRNELEDLSQTERDELAARQAIVTGDIVATGGDASWTDGQAVAIGGAATGITPELGVSLTLEGSVTATGGSGTSRDGAVAGISTFGSSYWSESFLTDDPLATWRVRGTVTVTGQGVDVADAEVFPNFDRFYDLRSTLSAGIRNTARGFNAIIIENGGHVEANGEYVHGIALAGEANVLTIADGATVIANGPNGSAIEVRPYQDPGFARYQEARDTTATIIIESGAMVTSLLGTGIRDDGRRAAVDYTLNYPEVDVYQEVYVNQTTVDIAGTVFGGGGTAIDLGTGADSLMLRATADLTGAVLLGEGDDRFAFEDGYGVSGTVDGGDGEDTIVADVASGDVHTLDLGAQPIVNFEVIEKLGAGELVLDGAALTTDYRLDALAGLTTIGRDFGTLDVAIADGATVASDFLVGDVTVGSGGIFRGNGTVENLVVNGTVAPGNSIGTITVTGDAIFNLGSTYEIEIAAPDQADLIAVTQKATINGGSLAIVTLDAATSYAAGQTYRILTADEGVERNADFTYDQPLSLLNVDVLYEANHVELLLQANVPFTSLADTYNQHQAASGLQDLAQSGDALAVYNEVVQLSLQTGAAEAVRRAYDLTSGEVHAAGQHLIDQTFALFSRTLRGQAAGQGAGPAEVAPLAYAPAHPSGPAIAAMGDALAGPRFAGQAWLAPLGGRGVIRADANAADLALASAGLAGGYDATVQLGDGAARFGVGFGYLQSHGQVAARGSTIEAASFNAGAYGSWTDGAWSVRGAVAYSLAAVSTERDIAFGGIDRTAEADYLAHTIGFSAEIAHHLAITEALTVSPIATLDAAWSGHGGFAESGASALDLFGSPESWARLDAGLGLALAYTLPTEAGDLTLEGRAVWEHAFADTAPDQGMRLAGSPTAFDVRGPDAGRDRLRLGTSISLSVTDDMSLKAGYSGTFAGNQANHTASLGLRLTF